MTLETQLRVGLIGCGTIAWGHALGWNRSRGVTIAAVADPVAGARDGIGDSFQVEPEHRYESGEALLASEELDVLSICTPAGDHLNSVVVATTRRPKVVLCEKPLAVCLGDAQAMRLAAERTGVRLAVSYQRRFYPGWSAARDAIRAGVIGDPIQVTTSVADGLLNNGTHNIDMIRYLLDEVDFAWVLGAAQRSTDRHERGLPIEDSAIAVIETVSGVHISLEAGCRRERPTANAVFTGSDGMLTVREGQVRVLNGQSRGWEEITAHPSRSLDPSLAADPGFVAVAKLTRYMGEPESQAFAELFVSQAESLAAWARGDQDCVRGEARHAYAALEAIVAIFESTRLREPVRLPLRVRTDPLDLMIESGQLPVTYPGRYDIRFAARPEAPTR